MLTKPSGHSPSVGFLRDLLDVLASPCDSAVLNAALANKALVGADPSNPNRLIRTHPDGTIEELAPVFGQRTRG